MKHSNFHAKVNQVKSLEQEELKKAVTSHGGVYQWNTENDNGYPVITINADLNNPQPQNIKVSEVTLVDDRLNIYAVSMKDNSPVTFTVDDVFAGQLSFVIDCIPPTNELPDTSLSFPVKTYKAVVGDELWLYNIDRRDKAKDRYGKVTRIGRKFFYMKTGIYSEERFDINTLKHDNGEDSPYYELYTSKEACEYHQKAVESRWAIGNQLYKFLTDKEAIELYDILNGRDK